jgi:hypothetical protein
MAGVVPLLAQPEAVGLRLRSPEAGKARTVAPKRATTRVDHGSATGDGQLGRREAGGDLMPGGRPPEYTPEIGEEICRRLSEGESLRRICADERMPHRATALLWAVCPTELTKEFSAQYARARQAQAEGYIEDVVDIADGRGLPDDRGDEDAPPDPIRDRLRVDTRKWIASKVLPKFADKLNLTGTLGLSIDGILAATDEGEAPE